MKCVLISINPYWCCEIANERKTIEVRKNKPKLEPPFKCYIYCTAGRPFIAFADVLRDDWDIKVCKLSGFSKEEAYRIFEVFNGSVMGEFICDEMLDLQIEISDPDAIEGCLIPFTGLTDKEIMQYLGNGQKGFGWHISKLEIYDSPRPLSDFGVERAPQSWRYVEELAA